MSDNAQEFGRMIKSLRLSHGLPQQQLADRLAVTKSFVSKIENGRAHFPLSNQILDNLAQIFSIPSWKLYLLAGKLPNDLEKSIALHLSSKIKKTPCTITLKIKITESGDVIVQN